MAPARRTRAASTPLFADGSVRFIRNTIKLEVWKALITRAGGEVVSSDQY